MPLYVFVCPDGHEAELLRPRTVELVSCACGQTARRREVNRFGVSGFAGTPVGQQDFREDYRRFSEASAETDYAATRIEYNEGVKLPSPPLFQAAKAEAKKMQAAGVTADQIST
jgi:hypothetical protein